VRQQFLCEFTLIVGLVLHPKTDQLAKLLEGRSARHKFIEVGVELLALILPVLLFTVLAQVLFKLNVVGALVIAENRIQSQLRYVYFDAVSTVEALMDDFRVLDGVLEVCAEVAVFMAAQIWKARV
jgi:hypothetical protein